MPTFLWGDLEERLLLSSLKQPLSWFRFIDDVDMKWTHGDKELDDFLEHANSIHPSIKFTHEVSKIKISFLDTTTTVKEGNKTTDVYSKPTDKHQYLSPSSCHPKHCFKSIPFRQASRIKRICSTVETNKQRPGGCFIVWWRGPEVLHFHFFAKKSSSEDLPPLCSQKVVTRDQAWRHTTYKM